MRVRARCPQTQTLEIEMADISSGKDKTLPQLATKMVLQVRPLRVSTRSVSPPPPTPIVTAETARHVGSSAEDQGWFYPDYARIPPSRTWCLVEGRAIT